MSEPKDDSMAIEAGRPSENADPTRRDFLDEVALAALGIAGLGGATVLIRYLSPNVLFEPPTRFRAGSPDLYPVNSVTYIPDQQVYIVRSPQGLLALSAVCTHLGCITQWKPEANLIACPCHGSKFKEDGTKIEGPAPRALPHLALTLTADGELLVDKSETVAPASLLRV
ncbi:MAG TPA: ubiquinol-cytochrome c reductase iron-sulfur subunit [Bryobacterales bacterium]|nr:ubiquinol-cytochrome c reductase iron-sulfur subunit [Bryobacterales bacterium]